MSKPHETASQVTGGYVEFQAAVLRALPRDIDLQVAFEWTKNGESLALILREALCPPRATVQETERVFPIWKTIILGLHKSSRDYEKALEKSGFRIGDYALQILKSMKVAETEIELDLVLVTPDLLGLKNSTYQQICDRAKELGLEMCPVEVGPALRLAYPDQPFGEWVWVGMDPVADSGGDLDVFRVGRRGDGRWLRTRWFDPLGAWPGDGQFVFVRLRK